MSLYEQKLKELRKVNESCSFENSKYGIISHFIDTSDFGLNLIATGSPLKGIPAGRVVLFNGESQVGKSFIICCIIKNALNKNKYDHIYYFDSEGGVLKENMSRQGIDLSKVEHVLVESVEDATVKVLRTIDTIKQIKAEEPERKFLMCLDSIGALVSNKVYVDALDKDKQASDRGGRAKLINTFIKAVTIPCLKSDTSILVTNHVYDDPAAMYQSSIKNTGGGKELGYQASISFQISRSLEKNEDAKSEGESKYSATILKFFTTKNRLVKPFYSSEMFLNFSTGPLKYFGLVNHAIRMGLITKVTTQSYSIPLAGEKNYKLKEIITSDELWDKIMPEFAKKCEEDMNYSSGCISDDDLLNENSEEIEEVIEEESDKK